MSGADQDAPAPEVEGGAPAAGVEPSAAGVEPSAVGDALPAEREPAEREPAERAPVAAPRRFAGTLELALAACAVLAIWANAIPAPFTVDESHHLVSVLALWDGQLAVKNTAGLAPSSELLFFAPEMMDLTVGSTPVFPRVPPLYAFIALPFSALGWHGLVFINVLCFVVSGLLLTRRLGARFDHPSARYVALAALGLGAYLLEYAQGLWPHLLSMALSFGGFLLAGRELQQPKRGQWAALAGLLCSVAVGIRYQNVVYAAGVAAGLFLFGGRARWRNTALFVAAGLLPLLLSGYLNSVRLGTWNPVSKGPGYATLAAGTPSDPIAGALMTLRMLAALVGDFSLRPAIPGEVHAYMTKDPVTGAIAIGHHLKKAWLQSAPWIAISLGALAVAWLRPRRDEFAEVRRASLVVVPSLLLFAAAGPLRTDGLCFNQRYFIELLPLVALALGYALRDVTLRWPLVVGGLLASVAVLAVGGQVPAQAPVLYLKVPLGLAAVALVSWAARRYRPGQVVLSAALGASIGWGLAVHVLDDLTESRRMRYDHWYGFQLIEASIPDHSAVVVSLAAKEAVAPLLFDRDVVVIVPNTDRGRTMATLVDQVEAQGRRVFVVVPGLHPVLQARATEGRPVRVATWVEATQAPVLLELGRRVEGARPAAP